MAAKPYNYTTANAGASGSYGNPGTLERKKRPPAESSGASQQQALPPAYTGGGGMFSGSFGAGVRPDPNTGYRGGVAPPENPPLQYGDQGGDNGLADGTQDGNDQLLLDNLATLMGSGPRDTAAAKDQIRTEQKQIMEQGLGRLMAQAGAGGMGSSGALGYGMADVARGSANDTNRLLLDEDRAAEKDWLDRLNTANNLYGTDMEIRSMDDYYELMAKILGEDTPSPEVGGGDPFVDEEGNYTLGSVNEGALGQLDSAHQAAAVGFGMPPGAKFVQGGQPTAEDTDVKRYGPYVYWVDPVGGPTFSIDPLNNTEV